MRILLTGGAGFIGSHVAEKLLAQNHHVVNLDNLDPYYAPSIKLKNINIAQKNPRYTFIRGDILDQKVITQIFHTFHFDAIIHLAAKVGVRASIDHPIEYAKTNVLGSISILEQARQNKIKKVILASSSSVYGDNLKIPFQENDPLIPNSPYGASKKIMEMYARTYYKLYDLEIACLRFFTVYGPRQRPDMAIHKFTSLILNNQSIPLYAEGLNQRDYTYIDDLANGIINTLKYHQGFAIYNLGNDKPISTLQIIDLISQNLNQKAETIKLPPEQGDMEKTWADIHKAKKKLRYQPQTDIQTGIQKFITWYQENLEIPNP